MGEAKACAKKVREGTTAGEFVPIAPQNEGNDVRGYYIPWPREQQSGSLRAGLE